MIQTPGAPAEFTVQNGENVTVTIEAFSCACNTGGAFDNNPLGHVSTDPDVYSFAVIGSSGENHFFGYVCHFFPSNLPNPHYVVSASGDRGGGTFRVRQVGLQIDPPAQFELKFTIS